MAEHLHPRVLVVEHHPLLREHIRQRLTTEPCVEIVGEASDAVHAVEEALRLAPNVIVIDQVLPDINGLQLVRLIRRLLPATRIIVLLDDQIQVYCQAALELGATTCIQKQALTTELLAAVTRDSGCEAGNTWTAEGGAA